MNKDIILFVALESELPRELVPPHVSVHYTGVGKVNAAIKATEVLTGLNGGLKPFNAIVLNYGSAGSNTVESGKLVDCRHFIQNDINTPFASNHATPFDEILYPELSDPIINFGSGYICRTQDRFEDKPMGVFDMEAYSIAKVCKIYGFDFRAYKYISDSGDSTDWEANHRKGADLFLSILNKI